MKELLDQTTKAMEKTWDMWQQMVVKAPWWEAQGTLPFKQWSTWFATMWTTYEMNTGLWRNFLDQGEENFFKLFRQSPLWNDSLEGQMRDAWSGLRKAQDTQLDILKSQWQKMEDILKGIS